VAVRGNPVPVEATALAMAITDEVLAVTDAIVTAATATIPFAKELWFNPKTMQLIDPAMSWLQLTVFPALVATGPLVTAMEEICEVE